MARRIALVVVRNDCRAKPYYNNCQIPKQIHFNSSPDSTACLPNG